MIEFKMPDIGEGVAEGEIVKWLVKEGDVVAEDQAFVEVMTDKATVVIPSPAAGTIRSILVGEGKSARVGQVVVTIAQEGDGQAAAPAQVAPAAAAPAPAQAAPTAAPPAPAHATPAAPAPVPASGGRESHPSVAGSRVLAAPATRRAAREAGVDLAGVPATGPHGRVTRDDLAAYLEALKNAPPVAPAPAAREEAHPAIPAASAPVPVTAVAPPETWPGEVAPPPPAAPSPATAVAFAPGPQPETRVPVRGIRRKIAENMRRSKDHAAHFTYVEECDMTELGALRASLEGVTREQGVRLTYLPFIVKAVTLGLRKFPYLNASYDEEAQEIVLKGHYGIGIAASAGDGLLVPVVKDCDRRGILDIATEIQRLAEGARKGTLQRDELTGGTFTITSLGRLGGILATPVINWPEVAILGVHRIRRRPVVKDDQVVIRDICYLSISIDHRVVDGQMGAEFMEHVVRLLEDPRLLLIG